MKKTLVFGTFDSLHKGHLYFLKKAALPDHELIAVVARDETVDELKGRTPIQTFKDREKALGATGLVNRCIPSDRERGSWNVIQKEKPHIICLGHDQDKMRASLEEWLSTEDDYNPEIRILAPYRRRIYSTTAYRKRREYLFILVLLFAMLIMAFSWISGKWVSNEAPFSLLVFWRFVFSLLPFIPLKQVKQRKDISYTAYLPVLFASLSLIAYNYFFFGGLSRGLAGRGGVIVTTLNPIITTLLLLLMAKDKPGKKLFAGLILGAAGGILLMEPWHISSAELFARGNLLFLAAAFSWALMTIFSSKALEYFSLREFNFRLYAISATLAFFPALKQNPFDPGHYSPSFWLNILFLALAVTSLATSLYFNAARKIGPARASSFTFIIPLLALILSGFFFKEVPTIPTVIGGTLSLISLAFINHSKRKTNEK